MISRQRQHDIWSQLVGGASFDDLALPTVGGRVDLRNYVPPVDTFNVSITGHWKRLDLSGARMPGLRFLGATIEDCRIERGGCRDWRMWRTTVVDSSFANSDLRGSALGGIQNGGRNVFRRVDFTRADLRSTAHISADYDQCRFVNAKLRKVDFQGSIFTDSTFEGSLREVMFYRHAFRGEAYPPNEMRGVDLRKASLEYTDFRGIDLRHASLPNDEHHVVFVDCRTALSHAIASLSSEPDEGCRRLGAYLASRLEWIPEAAARGVLHLGELCEVGEEPAVAVFLRTIERWRVPSGTAGE